MTLDELPRDALAVVTSMDTVGPQRRRLMDLGLLPGIEVRAERRSPLGDPTAYRVRGTLIVLRREQANGIHIERHAENVG
jgi:ferrous iron transport protein A